MRDLFITNIDLQLSTAISCYCVPIYIQRCFLERYDSAQYETQLRKMVQGVRKSVDVTPFVRILDVDSTTRNITESGSYRQRVYMNRTI